MQTFQINTFALNRAQQYCISSLVTESNSFASNNDRFSRASSHLSTRFSLRAIPPSPTPARTLDVKPRTGVSYPDSRELRDHGAAAHGQPPFSLAAPEEEFPRSFLHTVSFITWDNPLKQLAAAALDSLEYIMLAPLESPKRLPSTTDPSVQLEGNFFPVPENAVQHELEVEGCIPPALEGVYIRNGANPMFEPAAGHHLFDGDGMLHAVRFKQGIVSYANRFTRTYRVMEEMKREKAFFPKCVGELHGYGGFVRLLFFYARSMCGLVDASMGMGVANAGVVYFNGHLLAMSEDDLPYAVYVTSAGDLETMGRYDFNGQINFPMIAHPKMDALTGELFALSYDVLKKPFLKYFKFAQDGTKGPEVSISLQEPTMVHDFAITEKYVIIPDQQVVFRLQEMLTGGSPVMHNKQKISRFGILPRDDADESRIIWVPVPDCFCFHLWNAWEEEDEIVVIASCMTPADRIFNESAEGLQSVLSEIRLNRATGMSARRSLISDMNLEAGQVNKNYLGRKSRYAYLAIADPWPKVSGIAKIDLQAHKPGDDQQGNAGSSDGVDNIRVTKFWYPPNCYGGEPMFVPRSSDPSSEEDDGFLLTFMHNENTGKSELLILDARSSSLETLARVKLPTRVPYGFHGTFIGSNELAKQKETTRS